ncbi:CLUMA_CG005646, isoform A [Clunio marinus]|uniref:CLUMA_CG005646, isoform A n=1 Tax=Clunio marinus TaxID=568069 RepID=A0A1J1HX17_9DIPT|nr:CLUMA_CG005646, isoform A [Clunio marinus]
MEKRIFRLFLVATRSTLPSPPPHNIERMLLPHHHDKLVASNEALLIPIKCFTANFLYHEKNSKNFPEHSFHLRLQFALEKLIQGIFQLGSEMFYGLFLT